jgi:hypothetical protein
VSVAVAMPISVFLFFGYSNADQATTR